MRMLEMVVVLGGISVRDPHVRRRSETFEEEFRASDAGCNRYNIFGGRMDLIHWKGSMILRADFICCERCDSFPVFLRAAHHGRS